MLVMCHTRELAFQISKEYERFSKFLPAVKVNFFLSYNISIQVGVFFGRGPKMLDCWKFCIFIPLLNQWPCCFGLGLNDPTMSTCAAHYFSVLLNKLKTKTQVGVFFGGLAIAKDEQVLKNNCPHIVVGTPGRYLTCCIVSFLFLLLMKQLATALTLLDTLFFNFPTF